MGYTQAQWKEVFKHIWSKKTIQRIFEALVVQQLTLLEQFGKHRGDMTNWYSVDYDALERLVAKTHVDKLSSCPPDVAAQPGQPGLFDPTHEDKLSSSTKGQVVLLPKRTSCPLQHEDNLSSSSSKREYLKTNNNNTPARETEGSARSNGVVVVVPDESESPIPDRHLGDEDLPTPRVEAYRLLLQYGVTEHLILPLIRAHSDSEIERQVAHLDFERSQGKRLRNPGGRLAKMIREQWALPPGAEALYRRRFLAGDIVGETGPSAPAAEATSVEPDAFDLRLGALAEEERTTLRQRAERLAREQNPGMSERLLESQVIYHMRRLLPRPSRSANDSQDAS